MKPPPPALAPAEPGPDHDPFARVLRRAGAFLNQHPQPLLARGLVQLLLRAPARELEVRDRSGHLQRIDTRDQMGANLLVGRYRLAKAVIERVRPGDWVVDIGANIGLVTSQLCEAVGAGGTIWAFEPVPANLDRLRFLKERNGLDRLELFPCAVGAEDGTATLGLPRPGRSGWGSITKSFDIESRVEVPVRSLDAVVGNQGPAEASVGLVKIDVEGFEPEVVEGAVTVLQGHRPLVFCEFNDVLLRDRGRSSLDLLRLFADVGYRPDEPALAAPGQLAGRVVNLLLVSGPEREGAA